MRQTVSFVLNCRFVDEQKSEIVKAESKQLRRHNTFVVMHDMYVSIVSLIHYSVSVLKMLNILFVDLFACISLKLTIIISFNCLT